MPKRSGSKRYINLNHNEPGAPIPWYWRLIALIASWMILGGYANIFTPSQLRFLRRPKANMRTAATSSFLGST